MKPISRQKREQRSCVSYEQHPVGSGEVQNLGGFVGKRWRANRSGSIERFDIGKYVGMLETAEHTDWWWIGEQPGKWLESAVLTAAAEPGHAGLADTARSVAARIVAAQRPDGYLGITPHSVRSPAKPLRGMDPYEQYFTFHGLMSAFEVMGDRAALSAAVRLGDYYLRHIGHGKAEFWPSPLRPPGNKKTLICRQWTWVPEGTPQAPELFWHSDIAGHTAHNGWEGTLIIDPILRLYELTGERRFLEFALWVVSRIDEWSGWNAFSRLDDVAAGQAGVHELQPYVHAHTFHMNFLGFLRLYRATGDAGLLRKVRGAWEDIASRQMYITGGVSVGEHYRPGHQRPLTGEVVETCANMSWLQLTQELLLLTGEPAFADVVERLLLNHVFASQTVDGDSYRYHTPPNGEKPARYFHGPDCCTSSGHRLVSLLPSLFYARSDDAVIVNQFVPSTLTIQLGNAGPVTLVLSTDYPQEELVRLEIRCQPQTDFLLRLRIPGWCEGPQVSVNGEPWGPAKPGTYLDLRRRWSSGDRIELRLPMTPRWTSHLPALEDGPRVALTRGPVVYALDTVWWEDAAVPAPERVEESVRVPTALPRALQPVPLGSDELGPGLRARVDLAGGTGLDAVFVPFANVGRWYCDGEQQPSPDSAAFSYAVWLRTAE